jgi:predicted DNA-binding mobile mystery protein A
MSEATLKLYGSSCSRHEMALKNIYIWINCVFVNKRKSKIACFLYNLIYYIIMESLNFRKMQRKPVEKIERLQLDGVLNKLRSIIHVNRPVKGWIKVIRESLGMTAAQLAKRLGTTSARVSAIEAGEEADSLSLKTLNKVAQTLNCRLFYILIPEKSLQTMLEEQARKQVIKMSKNVSHSMLLEKQELDEESMKNYILVQVEEMLQKRINKVWEED